jgi:transcriptional regulator with XRE-family HTH domain
MKDSFQNRLNEAMRIRNMKQVDLVERTNLTKSAISQYCSGIYEPKQKALYLLAKALNEIRFLGKVVAFQSEVA